MPVYLEIIDGPHVAQTVALDPGDISRVGRAENADWCLPDDNNLSAVHFVITADEQSGLLCDLGSKDGTFLNGLQVTAAKIAHRDRIKAGNSTFVVFLENGRAKEIDVVNGSSMLETPLSRLIELLKSTDQPLFALLDAARDPRILSLLKSSDAQYQSLYNGASEVQLAEVAPYLVEFSPSDPFLEQVIRYGWGKAWGIFCLSSYPFMELRRHFRHFLIVQTPEGEFEYFRFYDPSVLKVFLPVCHFIEIRHFFGPIDAYLIEDDSPSVLLRFEREEDYLRIDRFTLTVPQL